MGLLFRDRRFLVLLALGFAAGVPLPLTGFVLRQWMSESNISLAAIGFTALIGLAYSLKFLWAPLIDRAPPPLFRSLGRRRGWLASIQPPLMLAIAAMGLTDPASAAAATAAVAVLVAFLSASQDIVVDAYRIEILEEREQGFGLACYIWGYRFALLASNAGALALVATLGWDGVFLYCAALVLVGFAAVLLAREPEPVAGEPAMGWGAALLLAGGLAVALLPVFATWLLWSALAWPLLIPALAYPLAWLAIRAASPRLSRASPEFAAALRDRVFAPVLDFSRHRYWLAILLFVALFKLGEALAGLMTAPFYRQLGFTRAEVAGVAVVFGLCATLLGVLVGGWVVARVGTGRALVATGLLQMLSNLMYVALHEAGRSMPMLYAQVGVENFTDGLADAAFVAYLSGLTSRNFTAIQYALLSSLAAVPLRTIGATSGWLAEWLGWVPFFLLTTAAALPALGLMLFLLRVVPPRDERPPADCSPASP
jgi:PAT family beta-lactamase induction signal transducer AmpG